MKHADSRPRVHLWRDHTRYWTYSFGPTQMRQGGGIAAGEQLDRALANLGPQRTAGGVVVIVEPPT